MYYDSDNNLIATVNGEHTLFFYYDENGGATSFSLGGNMYFYVKNLQGDIVNIVDSSGTVLVRYDYDVFGKITAIKNGSNQVITDTSSLAFLNPLRYRGYVYDDETGLYYLQSRYYGDKTYNLDICNEPALPEVKGDGEMWIYFWENPEVMEWNKVYVICGEHKLLFLFGRSWLYIKVIKITNSIVLILLFVVIPYQIKNTCAVPLTRSRAHILF